MTKDYLHSRLLENIDKGIPYSLYFFVLCLEVLGQKIQKVVISREWKSIKIGRSELKISHVFFADDLLLVGEASFKHEAIMERILREFCKEFRQKVNSQKS